MWRLLADRVRKVRTPEVDFDPRVETNHLRRPLGGLSPRLSRVNRRALLRSTPNGQCAAFEASSAACAPWTSTPTGSRRTRTRDCRKAPRAASINRELSALKRMFSVAL